MRTPKRPPKPELLTRGRDLFDQWIRQTGREEPQVAAALRVTKASVNNWRRALASPEPAFRELIAALSGGLVPADAWETEREREIRARAKDLLSSNAEAA